jgi:uncharacterized protein YyaL (SSP411 family)
VAVAKYMNANFVVCIVDREERPDVDQVYMTAAQLLTGSGGWLRYFSRWKTIFAGTYFPKENWLEMLHYFVQNKTPQALIDQAQVTEGVKNAENVSLWKKHRLPRLLI